MSVEHANVRASLNTFQGLVRSTLGPEPSLSPGQVDFACLAMQRLYNAFNCRKVETFLIPAVRKATHVADRLLAELDSLRRTAAQAMAGLLEHLRTVAVDTKAEVTRFCGFADTFCAALLGRLEREERELFSIARTVLPVETWFDIAHEMIAAETKTGKQRPRKVPERPAAMPPAPPPRPLRMEPDFARGLVS
jgi:hypothetical protein